MIEKKPFILIILLLFVMIFHYFDESNNKLVSEESNHDIKINSVSSKSTEKHLVSSQSSESINNSSAKSEVIVSEKKNPTNKNINKLVEIYGEPTSVSGNIYSWDYMSQTPWNKIVYNSDKEFPFYYFISAKINDLNEFESWKNILPNLEFDPKRKSLIFNTKDEATALAVANIVISNLQGKLSLEDILSKKLIPISITRTTHHDMIKHKIREQLTDLVNVDWNKKPKENLDYQEDIASSRKDNIDEKPNQPSISNSSPLAQNSNINNESNGLNAYIGSDGFSFI